MFIWMSVYRGGFAWREDPSIEFNLHPILMTFGLVFLYGNGKIYRKYICLFNLINSWLIVNVIYDKYYRHTNLPDLSGSTKKKSQNCPCNNHDSSSSLRSDRIDSCI